MAEVMESVRYSDLSQKDIERNLDIILATKEIVGPYGQEEGYVLDGGYQPNEKMKDEWASHIGIFRCHVNDLHEDYIEEVSLNFDENYAVVADSMDPDVNSHTVIHGFNPWNLLSDWKRSFKRIDDYIYMSTKPYCNKDGYFTLSESVFPHTHAISPLKEVGDGFLYRVIGVLVGSNSKFYKNYNTYLADSLLYPNKDIVIDIRRTTSDVITTKPTPGYDTIPEEVDREITGTKFNDLAPSLQAMLTTVAKKADYDKLNTTISNITRFGNTVLTIGTNYDRPDDARDDRNIHMNVQTNLIETFHSGKWNSRCVVWR